MLAGMDQHVMTHVFMEPQMQTIHNVYVIRLVTMEMDVTFNVQEMVFVTVPTSVSVILWWDGVVLTVKCQDVLVTLQPTLSVVAMVIVTVKK